MYEFCEWGQGIDYREAFEDVCAKVMDVMGEEHTIVSCELIEYPIVIAETWDEGPVGEEVYGYIADDSNGEIRRAQPLDCGTIDGKEEHMWCFYGIAE